MKPILLKKASFPIFQAADTEGYVPQRLLGPKREEPSRLTEALMT